MAACPIPLVVALAVCGGTGEVVGRGRRDRGRAGSADRQQHDQHDTRDQRFVRRADIGVCTDQCRRHQQQRRDQDIQRRRQHEHRARTGSHNPSKTARTATDPPSRAGRATPGQACQQDASRCGLRRQASAIPERIVSLREQINGTERATNRIGATISVLDRLRTQAANLAGPKVSAVA